VEKVKAAKAKVEAAKQNSAIGKFLIAEHC